MWVPYFKALALVFLNFFLVNSLSDTDLLVSTVPSLPLSHTLVTFYICMAYRGQIHLLSQPVTLR